MNSYLEILQLVRHLNETGAELARLMECGMNCQFSQEDLKRLHLVCKLIRSGAVEGHGSVGFCRMLGYDDE